MCQKPARERRAVSDYLKIPELADRLDISEKTARNYVKSGVIPSAFVGGAYRVSEEDLAEYLRQAEVRPGKAPAQPSEAGTETALTHERTRHYRAVAEQVEISSAYWESRLGDENGLSNDEAYSLLSFSRPFTNALEGLTNAELRDLREQYPDDEDLRYRSVLEPARFRWVGVVLSVARLRIFDYPDNPEARQMFREFREWTEALDKEYA
jgi:excisionase family DNA binding protein